MKKGSLYGVGVGPGDPELMTVKAIHQIKKCDVIGIPAKDRTSCTAYQIAEKMVPELEEKEIMCVTIPMVKDETVLAKAYDAGADKIAEYLEAGKDVAFLNLGDPTIYGTYMELHERIRKLGYETAVINGVPSFCAVAATVHTAVGARNEQIHILPGSYSLDDIDAFDGTKVLMKSGGNLDAVKQKLVDLEATGKISVCGVTNCGMDGQTQYHSAADLVVDAGYFTTIMVKEHD